MVRGVDIESVDLAAPRRRLVADRAGRDEAETAAARAGDDRRADGGGGKELQPAQSVALKVLSMIQPVDTSGPATPSRDVT
jgi:hypothetical protein